ncbi:F-box/kelch-repeat protein At4g39560-like isoform X1 [Raphanus sativus]|uniref:F-box/kelch-repeat protein At4g39560-like isoform X1 n=1 Tax=Raphanus sativus TaxID=3726 RepID=A0A6J0M1P4_RAPSA|nr:F-box/kelch-repeat protein At4g39560-like isoform X1 [Raphanus sativus]
MMMMMSGCYGGEEEEASSHRKKRKLSSSSAGIPLLPEEMVLSCLARVSRSEHASLSLVSKRHRSLLLTPELYNYRSLMGCTENLIYLCLRIPPDLDPRWFTLSLKPRDRRLVPVASRLPSSHVDLGYFNQPHEASSMVAHGCGIYVMGGRRFRRGSSSVMFLDGRSNTWSTLPSMGVARYSAAAGVVDGKIYVLGGCDDRESSRWGEVFDPEKQTWDALPMPPHHCSPHAMFESIVINQDKLVALNGAWECVSYTPSESRWNKMSKEKETFAVNKCWHVIDNVVYCSGLDGRVLWCEADEWERPETEAVEWREVMGLESLWETLAASKLVNYGGRMGDNWEANKPLMLEAGLEITELDEKLPGHKLSNSGNNMLIFWDVLAPNKLEIWCAEVSLVRHKETCQIRGNIVWSEAIMTLDPPPPHNFEEASAYVTYCLNG